MIFQESPIFSALAAALYIVIDSIAQQVRMLDFPLEMLQFYDFLNFQ